MIIFLYGADTFRSRTKLNEFRAKFNREIDPTGNAVKILNGEKCSLTDLWEALSSSSLFVQKKLVIIENLFQGKSVANEAQKLLEKSAQSENIVIIREENDLKKSHASKLFKFLTKQKFSQEFKPFSSSETASWIKKTAEERGGKISLRSAGTLAGLVGGDLWQISNEIDKLISYRKGASLNMADGPLSEIDDDSIRMLIKGKFDENIFALTDAIGAKNKALALRLLEGELENGQAETYLLHMIIRQFRILLQIKDSLSAGLSQRKIASDLKLHPFVLQKSQAQAQNYSLEFLKRLFAHLVKIDRHMKTGAGSLKMEMGLVIAKI